MENEIIFFEVNNWFAGRDYPDCKPFITWLGDDLNISFNNDNWCIENNLCVVAELIDMSQNFKVTATKKWVEENCPCLLTDEYSKFVCEIDLSEYEEDDNEYYENFRYGNGPFLKYHEDNFGVHFYDCDEGGFLP